MMPRAWTLLLCAYLLLWVPIGFAYELFVTLPSIARRGPAAFAELAVHGAGAAICAAGGWTLLVRSPAAASAAAGAVIVGALLSIQPLFWTVLPRQVAPGERVPLTALAIAHAVFWLVMIRHYARKERSGSSCRNSSGS